MRIHVRIREEFREGTALIRYPASLFHETTTEPVHPTRNAVHGVDHRASMLWIDEPNVISGRNRKILRKILDYFSCNVLAP